MSIEGFEGVHVDSERLESVDKEQLRREIIAVNSDKNLFERYHEYLSSGKKYKNKENSHLAFVLGLTDESPKGECSLLWFEIDTPDCDMDFGDRDGAIQYLVKKYGTERIAKIGTKNNYKVTNTVNEVCKALDIPRFDNAVEAVIKEIDAMNLSANDKRWDTVLIDVLDNTATGKRLLDKYPEFAVAKQITGLASNAGTHASGVIVANDSIKKSFAINPESQTIMAVADDLERKGYIKLDVLALANLTVIKKTMDMVGLTRDDLRTINLEDQKVFDVMNENRYQNIFQYEGAGVTKLAKQVKVDSFNDYIAISSFARPGPLSSGSAERWVHKKNGDMPVSYMHPLFEPYFKDTLGEMAYQEQIMLVAHDIAGLDWAIVSKMRKAIAKSMGAEALKEFGEPFKDGLMKAGVSEDVADKFWSDILGCGSYLFNKSHAAAYGLISYWTCYLKAYFPLEFACAALTTAENTDKQVSILRELDKEGTTYIPFDVENSTDEWRVIDKNGSKVLLAPLTAVKGIGNKTMTQIMACRARNEPLPESIQKRLNKATSVFSTLTPVKDYTIENNLRRHVIGDFVDIGTIECNGEWQEGLYIAGVCDVIAERDENDDKRVQDRIARGQQGIMSGATKFVELRVRDDTGTVYAKIGKNDFNLWGEEILEKGREKKTVVVIKMTYCPEAPVGLVKGFKIVGEIE